MDVCTGEVTIRGAGQVTARVTPLPVSAARISVQAGPTAAMRMPGVP